jgi:cytochrome c-type biogenesis protein CcmH/NrfG
MVTAYVTIAKGSAPSLLFAGMKRYFTLVIILLAAVSMARADGLDDQYVQIFNLIQEADSLSSNHPKQALAKYLQARTSLQTLKSGSPEWNSKVVGFRLSYVDAKIAALSEKAPAAAPSLSADKTGAVGAPVRPLPPAPSPTEREAAAQDQVRQLQAERGALQAKLKEALAVVPAKSDPQELARAEEKIKALQKENQSLKLNANASRPATAPASSAQDDTRIKKLEHERNELKAELALARALPPPAPAAAPAAVAAAESNRVKQLERERDDLQKQKQLDTANKEPHARKGKTTTAQAETQTQLAVARARIDVLEAHPAPYSTEELALFKEPATQLAQVPTAPSKKPDKALPPGTVQLVAEAQKYFAAHQYDKAEQTYTQVLQHDENNLLALANLAAIQVEAQHFDAAEANIKKALAIDGEDAYSLYVLGILRVRQRRFDEALDALSHAAKLDPQNPEIQNYLGLTLSEKGLRGPAESALRKAVELHPTYGSAHYNLAVFYLSQQPAYPALARWHYQKAIAAGHPANADVEKRLETRQ